MTTQPSPNSSRITPSRASQRFLRPLLLLSVGCAALSGVTPAEAQTVVIRDIDAVSNPPNITIRLDPVDDSSEHQLIVGLRGEDFKLQFYAKPGDDSPMKAKPKDKDPISVVGTKVVNAKDANIDTAMVVLIEGAKIFVGDSEYVKPGGPDDPTPIPGALSAAKKAAQIVAEAVKTGSVGVYFYGDQVIERIPLGPPGGVKDIDVVKQEEFKAVKSRGFFSGVDAALGALVRINKPRKILVIISDGIEGLQDGARADTYADKARRAGIEVYAIQYSDNENLKGGDKNMKTLGELGMYRNTRAPNQIEEFAKRVKEQIEEQYIVEFEAKPAPWSKTKDKPEQRALKVIAKDVTSDKTEASFGYYKTGGGGAVWPYIVFPLVGLFLIIGLFMLLKKKPAPEPMEMPMAPPVVAAPPAPAPMKTMMLGFAGGGDEFPMVGWIVALTGANAGQTFKLQQGRTTVGTTPDQNIVVQDQFMSTRHAEVIMGPTGWQLIDIGSTNGSFVNGKRIKSHELVDNDAFVLGKTEFKFKSIN